MKDSKKIAIGLVLGSVALVSGCTGRLRHQDNTFHDSVKLPSAPKIDAAAGPGPIPGAAAGSVAPGAAPSATIPTPNPFDH